MNLFDAALRLKGFDIAEARSSLKYIQNLDQTSFDQLVLDKRKQVLDFHLLNNKWYQDFIGNTKINSWNDLPIMNKSDIQIDLQKLLSNGYSLSNVYSNNTSGSTGRPFHFVKDKRAHALTWAVILDRFGRHGIDFNHSLQARFFGIPLKGRKYFQEKIKDQFSHRVRFPVFDLSDKKMAEYLERFYKYKFEYLNGYTSSLVLFAKYLISQKLILKNICPTLKVCIVTSEVCTQIDRNILELGFGVKVVNEYGAAELDLIAFEDENFNWIMNNENLFFEIIDDNDQPCPYNVHGRMIVTSLNNKAMPFIRYNLGDICKISDRRIGNNHILDSLIGRTNDIAILPSGKRSPGLTFYYISKGLMEDGGFMKEFVIKQQEVDLFVFEYVSEKRITEKQESKINEMMDLYLEPGLRTSFKKVDQIERSKAGKFKHFQTFVKT